MNAERRLRRRYADRSERISGLRAPRAWTNRRATATARAKGKSNSKSNSLGNTIGTLLREGLVSSLSNVPMVFQSFSLFFCSSGLVA
jgi:hypothetical protein